MEANSFHLARYDVPGPPLWHERFCGGVSRRGGWRAVATPDGDMYMEDCANTNVDIVEIRPLAAQGAVPPGVPARRIYRFRAPLTAAECADYLLRGAALVAVHDAGLPPVVLPFAGAGAAPAGMAMVGGGAPAPAAALGRRVAEPMGLPGEARPRLVPAGGAFALDEPAGEYDVGELFALPQDAPRLGNRSFALLNGTVTSFTFLEGGNNLTEFSRARGDLLAYDRRTLPQKHLGDPVLTFGAVAADMAVIADPAGPLPLAGAATAEWFVRAVSAQGLDMMTRHHRWVHDSGVKASSMAIHEHHVLSLAIQMAVLHDRLNVLNLSSFELLLRRMQLHESAVAESPEAPSYEGAQHFLGTGDRRGGALVAPSLTAHVASELGREAAIMKEKRKVREAKAAGGRGGGKGGAAAPAAKQ